MAEYFHSTRRVARRRPGESQQSTRIACGPRRPVRAAGSAVLTLFPPPEVRDIFDANAANPANRRRAALAGFGQAPGLLDLEW